MADMVCAAETAPAAGHHRHIADVMGWRLGLIWIDDVDLDKAEAFNTVGDYGSMFPPLLLLKSLRRTYNVRAA